ncbi:uncharacterized protein LOC118488174 [Helianthus annuus]|uniref:uncharacterized protein LOC118488174 n=1 Tax=Helianthus annuus TaxID=4232 RepID=UPI001652B9EE|nr:uncharacterized protein LOC118488174 [Helianthus annuus]
MKIIIFSLYPNEDHHLQTLISSHIFQTLSFLLCFFSLSSSIASLPRLSISTPPSPPPPIHRRLLIAATSSDLDASTATNTSSEVKDIDGGGGSTAPTSPKMSPTTNAVHGGGVVVVVGFKSVGFKFLFLSLSSCENVEKKLLKDVEVSVEEVNGLLSYTFGLFLQTQNYPLKGYFGYAF